MMQRFTISFLIGLLLGVAAGAFPETPRASETPAKFAGTYRIEDWKDLEGSKLFHFFYLHHSGEFLLAAQWPEREDSRAVGTDELVDVLLPMDGTWQIYVHGWYTPDGDSDYVMDSWLIPITPGGSLTIDTAPTAATLATTGAIEVSWSDLASDTRYMGAVSHHNEAGPIGITLLTVDSSAAVAATADHGQNAHGQEARRVNQSQEPNDSFRVFLPYIDN